MYDWLIANKEWLKIIYALIILAICSIIGVRTNRLFKLSLHQGIRYFRNAFLFYGVGFFSRYFLLALASHYHEKIFALFSRFLFEFFMIMAGFFLLYSLVWRKFEKEGRATKSSLFNLGVLFFYFITLILVLLDLIWNFYYFMFFSQVILFFFASCLSCKNYLAKGKERGFLKFYFIAMLLGLIAWSLNAAVVLFFNYNQKIVIDIYLANLVFFFLFLYGIIKTTFHK